MTPVRVIGLGQMAAGDDGVGAAVARALEARPLPRHVHVIEAADASALVALVEPGLRIVLVDAVLGHPAGQVVEPTLSTLASGSARAVSSHGLGVPEAVGLAQALGGADPSAVRIVAITIHRPEGYRSGLSPEVAAAVPAALERVMALLP